VSHVGRLLVATPLIGDPHFERSVVALIDHGPEGSFGVVLNRPSDTAVAAVAPEWADHVPAPGVLFVGGPVAADTVMGFGHLPPGQSRDFRPLVAGMGTVDLHDPPAPGEDWAGVRLFAGSAGWAPGQLDDELSEGAWWPVDAEPGDLLSTDPSGLWRRVLRRQPGTIAWFANAPTDPSSN